MATTAAINLLTTALQPDPGLSATSSPSAQDSASGLFQSVLANVVAQSVTSAVTTVPTAAGNATGGTLDANGLPTQVSDALAGLLGLSADQQTQALNDLLDKEQALADAASSDLLAQLLAAIAPALPQIATTPPTTGTATTPTTPTTATTNAAITAATATTTTITAQTTSLFPTTTAPVATTLPQTLPSTAATAQARPSTTPTTPALAATAQTPAATTTVATIPTTVTPADAKDLATRGSVVAAQVPILTDRGQQLPPPLQPVGPDAVQPPISEAPAVKGVAAGGSPVRADQMKEQLPQANAVTASVTTRNAPTGSVTFNAALETVGGPPAAQTTLPSAAPTTNAPTTSQPAAVSTTPASNVPTTAPAPTTTARVVPQTVPTNALTQPTPLLGMSVSVAQPVSVAGPRIDFSKLPGVTTGFPTGTRIEDQLTTGKDGTPGIPQTAGPTPLSTTAPAAVDRPAAPAPVAPPSLADQLAAPAAAHVQAKVSGETEVRIRLDPPELGTVKMKLVSSGNDLRAEVLVADHAVRRVIESQLPELRQKLEDAGVRVQRFDVAADPNPGGNSDGRNNRWQPAAEDAAPPFTPIRPRPTTTPVPPSAADRIDVTA